MTVKLKTTKLIRHLQYSDFTFLAAIKKIVILMFAMICLFSYALELSHRTISWIELKHPLLNDLSSMGIKGHKFSYNRISKEYSLDLQHTNISNLNSVAAVIRKYNLSMPPVGLQKYNSTYHEIELLYQNTFFNSYLYSSDAEKKSTIPTFLSDPNSCTLRINICNTKVTSLSPLCGLPVSAIWLANAPVADLSPIKKMPLKSLHIVGTEVEDITVISCTGIEELFFNPLSIKKGINKLRQSKSLKLINEKSPEQFWEWYNEAILKEKSK